MCKGPPVLSVAGAEARGGGRPDPQGLESGEGLGPRSVGPRCHRRFPQRTDTVQFVLLFSLMS